MKAQVIYKAKTIITIDLKHVLFVYFIILLKEDVPILFTLQLQCWELSHSILCMFSINDQSGMLLAFDLLELY